MRMGGVSLLSVVVPRVATLFVKSGSVVLPSLFVPPPFNPSCLPNIALSVAEIAPWVEHSVALLVAAQPCPTSSPKSPLSTPSDSL